MKKSKILILLSLAAIAAGCALAFAGCKPHSAQNSSSADSASDPVSFQWVTDKEATCTEAGSKHKECTCCGEILEQKIIYPKGHNFVGNVCSVCGATASEGLLYNFSRDGSGYSVVGIGSCTDKDVVIPSSHQNLPVTEIGHAAFSQCGITSVALPDSVTFIGNDAFYDCRNLTSVVLPDSVTSIGEDAFAYCNSLTSIIIPEGVTSIDFYECTNLTSVALPDSVTSIGFYGCTNLTSISIPDGVTSIGIEAFRNCSSLTSISIPNGVTSIGRGAFFSCSGLTSISIPDGVTTINRDTFGHCSNLTSISIPENVTSIGERAFAECISLTSIALPDGIISVEHSTFVYCSGLTSIILPESLVSIGNWAFEDCSALTSVYYKGTKAEWDEISIGSTNEALQSATIYYYSETKPPLNGDGTAYDGNYWRYAADGVTPVIWKKQTAA